VAVRKIRRKRNQVSKTKRYKLRESRVFTSKHNFFFVPAPRWRNKSQNPVRKTPQFLNFKRKGQRINHYKISPKIYSEIRRKIRHRARYQVQLRIKNFKARRLSNQ